MAAKRAFNDGTRAAISSAVPSMPTTSRGRAADVVERVPAQPAMARERAHAERHARDHRERSLGADEQLQRARAGRWIVDGGADLLAAAVDAFDGEHHVLDLAVARAQL